MECQRNSNYVRLRKEVLRRVQGEPIWIFSIVTLFPTQTTSRNLPIRETIQTYQKKLITRIATLFGWLPLLLRVSYYNPDILGIQGIEQTKVPGKGVYHV